MKNLELTIVSVLNAAVPVCLYYMIIFYLFFTHGSGNGAEIYVENYGIYWMLGYVIVGILQAFLVYRFFKIQKLYQFLLIVLILMIYSSVAYTNMY